MLKTAYMKKYLKYGFMGILAAIVSFLFLKPEKKEVKSTVRSYEEIIQSGVLRAITEYNAFSFHAQEDTVSGFHYELIQAFAKSKNLEVDIIPEMSLEKRSLQSLRTSLNSRINRLFLLLKARLMLLFLGPLILMKHMKIHMDLI